MKRPFYIIIIVALVAIGVLIYKTDILSPLTKKPINPLVASKNNSGSAPIQYQSPISIDYLRSLKFESSGLNIEQELEPGSNYKRYIASYISDGYKIYGLLTVPEGDTPQGGFPAIVFNHGYIPPNQYKTTEKYVAYVDYLARNGFVVFKIDFRGNGNSEGNPSGTYFSSGYTIDAINAVKSLEKYDPVNPNRIGIWGHSMSGNLVLRAMEVLPDIKAGVIWAGAVYSYEDMAKYRINDNSYVGRPHNAQTEDQREASSSFRSMLDRPSGTDFNDPQWSSISLTKNIKYLNSPIEIHHAVDDPAVNIGYSHDLVQVLKDNNKKYEYYEYPGGGHNINSPYFEQAMQRTVDFFKANL